MITGAAGFLGSHVARAAARHGGALVLAAHHRRPAPPSAAGVVVRADLGDPASLRGLCDGVQVLLHCASAVGGSPERNRAVNALGTAALLAEAARAGVERVVYVSTASVYGRGRYLGERPEQLTRRPGSPTSRTRAEAEEAVLAYGGTVLRPHLVYGPGDRWVVPGLRRLLARLAVTPTGWRTRHSVIAADELGTLVAAVGHAPAGRLRSPVYHLAHPEPVPAAALLAAAARCGPRPPSAPLTLEQARARVAADPAAAHALAMLADDHWFDSTPLWTDLGRRPGRAPGTDLTQFKEWYPWSTPSSDAAA
nr:NAD-dependent epimerase/dehydratase family protein [Kitasatospora sp. SID7827]